SQQQPPPPHTQQPQQHQQQQPPPQHAHRPPPPPPQSTHYPPGPSPVEHWQHHAQPPAPPQQPPLPPSQAQAQHHSPVQTYDYQRSSSLAGNVAPPPKSGPSEEEKAAAASRQGAIDEILSHCTVLYHFASRCAQSQLQPSAEEVQEMAQRATTVVRLMEDLRRLSLPEEQLKQLASTVAQAHVQQEESRPPKRPWEDISREDGNVPQSSDPRQEYTDEKMQSTAEKDMEIIRSKRATSAAGNTPGMPKSKYRKRSRATPPGKCHSCNIRETPEWRRGPDGARTLCNACGLHYAKLMRKRDKAAVGPDGKPTITIESLRASTASARGGEPVDTPPTPQPGPSHPQMQQPPAAQSSPAHHSNGAAQPQQVYEHPAPKQQAPPPPQMHQLQPPHHPHGGPYHLMPPPAQGGPPPSGQHHPHQMIPPPHSSHNDGGAAGVPPPPWSSNHPPPSSGRGYVGEHQSYLRTHPSSHARASPH
ncbi:hypothetical protein ABKN59_010070, partial [Abortiporus biennis]